MTANPSISHNMSLTSTSLATKGLFAYSVFPAWLVADACLSPLIAADDGEGLVSMVAGTTFLAVLGAVLTSLILGLLSVRRREADSLVGKLVLWISSLTLLHFVIAMVVGLSMLS